MAGRFPEAFLEELRAALPVLDVVSRRYKMRKAGSAEYEAIDDESLTVNTVKSLWYDHGKGKTGGDIFDFEMFATGCPFTEAVENLAKIAGLPLPKGSGSSSAARSSPKPNGSAPDMGPEPPPYGSPSTHPNAPVVAQRRASPREITATYDYEDPDGQLIYQVCRQEWIGNDGRRKKNFIQRRPYGPLAEDRTKQCWVWGLGDGVFLRGRDGNFYAANEERLAKWTGAERIEIKEPCPHSLYRLPQLREEMAQPESERRIIFCPEGEKDVRTLEDWGCLAVTNSGGASSWKPEHAEELHDADVVVPLDNDAAGRKRGHEVALSLRGVAKRVRVLSWPDFWRECPDGGDVTDWKEKGGGDLDKLFAIVEKLPDWSPAVPATVFGAVRYADIDNHAAPLLWTIKNILQRATVSLWYGPPGSGKSFLLTDAAMAIARGTHWMGRRTRPGLVIYQTGEGGVGFRLRLKAYRQHHKLPHEDDIPFVYLPVRINLFVDGADVDKLIDEIKAWASYYDYPLELVVIDTFNAASGGANENANQDVGRVLDRCRKIVDATGAHVAVVHHTPAAGGKPRGHSSLVGDVETTVGVDRSEQIQQEQADDGHMVSRQIINWSLTKQKDEQSGVGSSFVLKQIKLGNDDDGDPLTSCVIEPTQSAAAAATTRAIPKDWVQLNPANEDIFRSLVRAINAKGRKPPPEIANAPPGDVCVAIKDWQDEMLQLYVGHEEITATLRNRIKLKIWRASKKWLPDVGGRNLIVIKDGWVWRTSRRVFMIDREPAPMVVASREQEAILAPGEDPGLPWN